MYSIYKISFNLYKTRQGSYEQIIKKLRKLKKHKQKNKKTQVKL
tara:strand:+ start:2397 stop:2528 length:132 start_codon:yes stop_codon:yes gene_type:complete